MTYPWTLYWNLPPAIHVAVLLLGCILLLQPAMLAFLIARRWIPGWQRALCGVGFGLTVLPLGMWLYMEFYTGDLRALLFGFPGLFIMLGHVYPLTVLGALAESTLTQLQTREATEVLPSFATAAVFWGAVYGSAGYLADRHYDGKSALHHDRD